MFISCRFNQPDALPVPVESSHGLSCSEMATTTLQSLLSQPQLRSLVDRYGRWLPPALNLLLLLLLAYLLAGLLWALVPTPAGAAWQPPTAEISTQTGGKTFDAKAFAGAALFGRYQTPANPSVTALANAPETQLNLQLLGILANRLVPQNSRAVVNGGSGGEKPFSLGDDISPGVLLKAIFPDRVVLSRKGRLETLRLNRDRPNSGGNVAPIAVDRGATGNASAKLSQIRNELLSNPTKAGDFIRVQPVAGPGGQGQLGYRVYPGPNRTAFTASGLHPGDLVTAVNGVPLSNPAETLQLLSQLSQASSVSLSIQRGKQSQTVNLNFGQ